MEGHATPLFMDVHNLDSGVSTEDAAQAHRADLAHQGAHGVTYQRHWVDESHGRILCLVDAPDAEAARTVHQEAHGPDADAIFPVQEGGLTTGPTRGPNTPPISGDRKKGLRR
jgi:hypothetical protein